MAHRIDLSVLDLSISVEDVRAVMRESIHSSYPVYDKDGEDVVGIVELKDLIFEIHKDDFMSYFNLNDNYVPSDYTTLAGLILEKAKRIPTVGDTFEFQDLLLEIGDMDGARIDRVIVTKQSA